MFSLEDTNTIGLSILFCLRQKVNKKPKKKQKLNWNFDARNRAWAV